MDNKTRKSYLGPATEYIVYAGELEGIRQATCMIKEWMGEKTLFIFTDSQRAAEGSLKEGRKKGRMGGWVHIQRSLD
jgi:hypothetical protein